MENLVKFDWSGRRVLVTGATGIVGTHLVTKLVSKGARTVVLVRDWDPQSDLIRTGVINSTTVVEGSLEDFSSVERAINGEEVDTVFHLGAQALVGPAFRNPLPTFEANIRGTYLLLEACRIHAGLVKRVVVASSDKAYGEALSLPYTEDMPLNGRHPYDVSKTCTDLLALTYAHTYQLPVGILRCGNIYGPGDLNWSRIVPGTIRSLLQGERPVLRSDGTFLRDYLYVDDAVNAYLTIAEHLPEVTGEAFNFSPECALSVLDCVDAIRHEMGRLDLEPVILNEAKAEIVHQYLSCEKAARKFQWKPQFSFKEGLRRTIPWYEALLQGSSRMVA
jgi:CDP-glucose 4,6-dehydratase